MVPQTHRLTSAIAVVVAVCLGVRLAAWFIAPLLPVLLVLGFLLAIWRLLLRR